MAQQHYVAPFSASLRAATVPASIYTQTGDGWSLQSDADNDCLIKITSTQAQLDALNANASYVQAPDFEVIETYGYGATDGGKGGKVYVVSNLNDNGAGSLREALTASGKRIILFSISGTITLLSRIEVENGNLTVDGSTAPNGGICIRGENIVWKCNDVILRHIRIRPGGLGYVANLDNNNALLINNASRLFIEHCSFSWSTDQLAGIQAASDITIANCLFSQALYNAGHSDNPHSMGLLCLNASNITIYNNLFAHCTDRVPLSSGGDNAQIVNNIIYNTVNSLIKIELSSGGNANVIANQNIAGLDTNPSGENAKSCLRIDSACNVYQSGNRCQLRDSDEDDEIAALNNNGGTLLATPVLMPALTQRNADDAKSYVLANAGARLPQFDSHDSQMILDVSNGTGNIVDEAGNWPDLTS